MHHNSDKYMCFLANKICNQVGTELLRDLWHVGCNMQPQYKAEGEKDKETQLFSTHVHHQNEIIR